MAGRRILQMGRSLDQCFEQWVGWSFPPPVRAIEEAKWRADELGSYCGRCGDSVGEGEASEEGCATCRNDGELAGGIGDGVIRLGPYIDSLRDWILAVKFSRWSEMGEHLGQLLGAAVARSALVDVNRAIVIPVPMPWQRRFYRGIDHARVIAEGVACELRAPVVAVLKKAHRPPQVSLAPSERKRSGSRGLALRWRMRGWSLADLDVVLVDDVRTTGASLRAAIRLLRPLKPRKIVCAAVAISDARARRARGSSAATIELKTSETTADSGIASA